MSTPRAVARIFGFVAAKADVCVLLRRGPSKQVLLVRWNLATDEFEIGQWLKGRVYEEQSDLSPDGRLFAYFSTDNRGTQRKYQSFTALSRPPYFTALALWVEYGTWGGGAFWEDPSRLRLATGGATPTLGRIPNRLQTSSSTFGENRLWIESAFSTVQGRIHARASRSGHRIARLSDGRRFLDCEALDAQWVDIDHRGRLLLAREGRIFVRDDEGERELIDLNPYEFRPLAPPEWAREWPE